MEYIDGVMNYTGSKFKLLNQILPELNYRKPYFIDLFTGGGSVYVNVLDKYEKVISNDIIEDLIGIHNSLLISDSIINETKSICPEKNKKEIFESLRIDYNEDKTPAKLWALMLSSTNNMMRFNKKFKYNQTYGNRGWNSNTDKKVELFTERIRNYKDKISFVSKHFNEFKIDSDKFMVYIDPPYKGTEAGYNAYWSNNDEETLYEYLNHLDSMGSSFMISGLVKHNEKESALLKKLISDGFRCKKLEFDYNKVSRVGKKETSEVIIMNY